MKYAITGGAGHISKPLVKLLLSAGHKVTVIGRDENHLNELADTGAQKAIGTLEDVQFLKKAFAGADAVYTMCPPNFMTSDLKGFYEGLGKNYAEAILATGIQYLVNLSSIGAHLAEGAGPASGLYRTEKALNTLKDVNIKHLRPAYFYSNLETLAGMIKNMGIIGNNFSNTGKRFPIAAATDISEVAAEELTGLNFSGHSIRYLASDETDTEEIAAAIGKAIGKPGLKWMKFNDDDALEGLLRAGFSKEIAADFIELGNAINSGKLVEDYWKNRPSRLGRVKLADFAEIFALAYNHHHYE